MGEHKDCKYAILDTVWGEYKCAKKHHRIYDPKECVECKLYESKDAKNTPPFMEKT